MQAVCDVLEQLLSEGVIRGYANLVSLPDFDRKRLHEIFDRHGLKDRILDLLPALPVD